MKKTDWLGKGKAIWLLGAALLILVLAASWNFYRMDRTSEALIDSGKSEELYWTVAQLHVELERTRAELIHFSLSPEGRQPDLDRQRQLLQSRYLVFEAPDSVLVHRLLSQVSGFYELTATLKPLIHDGQWPAMTAARALAMVNRIDEARPVLASFSVQTRRAELAARVARSKALANQRSQMMVWQIVLCFGIAGVLLMLFRYREMKSLAEARQSLLEQERAAHKATVDLELERITFLGALGHEIRSPMQSMQMCLELIEPAIARQGPAAMAMQRLRVGMDQLASQLRDIMDISAIKNMQLRLNPGLVGLDKIFRSLLDTMKPLAEARGLYLAYEGGELPEQAWLDEIRLRQIVGNLLSNAIRYTDHGGVTLSTGLAERDGARCLLIEVRDTGIGIAEEDRYRLFQPYSRCKHRRPGSNGLGLSIVKELVGLFSGVIELESEVDAGSAFRVWIPLRESGAGNEAAPIAEEQSRPAE
ncbi:HAMP domain-containing sensor histidine kinase [Chromobacterium sp. IIBBL 290-4]|uniref:sensor histidine kinase n=1 Tax=Chromobacterium sp. IIBBL 290-4 TaxID=2953890 RepID=UPI0020B69FE1|nr:HAMP domain-containing sensor histidine kinase [Chromobacterium sp. IIBBL 290-4]UTH73072.1 HAMP domain-containing histidine kinase [Chromobacterium sp. IIBBL 290-4]